MTSGSGFYHFDLIGSPQPRYLPCPLTKLQNVFLHEPILKAMDAKRTKRKLWHMFPERALQECTLLLTTTIARHEEDDMRNLITTTAPHG